MSYKVGKKLTDLILKHPNASDEKIAKKAGCSVKSISAAKSHLRKAGYTIPYRSAAPKRVRETAMDHPAASAKEIAELTGCSIGTAENVIRALKREKISAQAKQIISEADTEGQAESPSVRVFQRITDGFISQIQMFTQTNEINAQEAERILSESYEKAKEVIGIGK